MHTSMILETWLCCMCVWCIYPWCGNFVTEGRTDEPTVILTRLCKMHVFIMRHICHTCTNLFSDAYIHYACMYYAYTYAPSYVHDAYICDIQSLTMLHVCMMRLKFCDQPTNQTTDKAIIGVGCSMPVRIANDPFWAFWGVPKMALGVPESKF